jgi:DNA-directed RNA polymerase subunit L
MSAQSQMSNSVLDSSIIPRVDLISKIDDEELMFTLSGVNVSIANALRRIILSDIPIIVFRVSPHNKNKCNIISNTCGLNNEIVKHRLSCIPINIEDIDSFPLKNYILEVNVQNNTDTSMVVTTKDFVIKDLVSGKSLPEDKIREIFPANNLTGDYIDFVRLKAKPSEEIQGKIINLTCEFEIGAAKEDGAFNAVSTCSYGNTIDDVTQEAKLQQLKQKWKDDGKKDSEVDFEAANWKLLEGKRIFKKDSFDFIIQSIGIYTNINLITTACKIMIDKVTNVENMLEKDEITIKSSDNTMSNSYDVILEGEDYTVGKVIEYFLLTNFYEKKMMTFCGFKMMHPHDTYSIIRVAYAEAVEISTIKGHLNECISYTKDVFRKINKSFTQLKSK